MYGITEHRKNPSHRRKILLTPNRRPKPWHIIKKRRIVPDGLVQARLTHFRKLSNKGMGADTDVVLSLGSTNGKTGKMIRILQRQATKEGLNSEPNLDCL